MKAFPYNREIPSDKEGYKAYASEDGMDLRDYFAAQVLNGFQARDDFDDIADFAIVKRCYEIADQMMKAREVNEKL